MIVTPSDLLYDAVWHAPATRRDWVAVPNELSGHDFFAFAPESRMDAKYALLRHLVGSADLPLADLTLWDRRSDSLEHLYHRFFRRRSGGVPAFWWVWGRVPARSLNRPSRVSNREEGLFGFESAPAPGRTNRVRALQLSGGKVLNIPLALLQPVEVKLTQRVAFQRRLSLRDATSGAFLAAEFHDEIQLGTAANAAAIQRGRFEDQAADGDIVPLVRTLTGEWYFDALAVFLVRAVPVRETGYGPRYSACRFEAVYVSYRLIGCANKVGTIHGAFNPWALAHPQLCFALHQINPFGKLAG